MSLDFLFKNVAWLWDESKKFKSQFQLYTRILELLNAKIFVLLSINFIHYKHLLYFTINTYWTFYLSCTAMFKLSLKNRQKSILYNRCIRTCNTCSFRSENFAIELLNVLKSVSVHCRASLENSQRFFLNISFKFQLELLWWLVMITK